MPETSEGQEPADADHHEPGDHGHVEGGTDAHAELPEPGPAPTWDEESQAAALERGSTAMAVFARPHLDAATWWAELTPLLTAAAAMAYEGTDPAEVPARQVTGPARLAGQDTPYLAHVLVPTDVGEYDVLLSRQSADEAWQVERLTPPEVLTLPLPPPAPPAPGGPAPPVGP
ncbi:hypothetical protein CLV92_11926 [Kineococcus xinjiangensis]|uniref:Uncharacterized protein n=1 Tax=Kineococcus xinjiangensis TaxID=512762 RepID=A0A2S6ICJ9_9ACTN|nr:hypothetical protein [Kineococcus xinjiangensis]PPK91945.1 hypothetical protein CLV92_11926 [Kineococcus xinjiangensis]